MRITFLGAAREVTGSCYWIRAGERSFLVDCGMFQGGADAWRKNRARFAFDPARIDCVLLTHAHIDHSGLLPRLLELGFRGPVYATAATCDLLSVMLPDAAYVQEREAEPLYTMPQAQATLRLLRPVEYDKTFDLHPGLRCRFRDAGHILGSAIIELWSQTPDATRKVVFSGDIGETGRPIVNDPTPIGEADTLLVESTYGNRRHKSLAQTEEELAGIVNAMLKHRRGNIVVPAFAVGRTQELLHILAGLVRRGGIRGRLSVYVDSPLATRATEVTLRHQSIVDRETRDLIAWGRANGGGAGLQVRFTESLEESKKLNHVRHGALIISASGMCDAGRIKYHLLHNLPSEDSVIVFTGFQAGGTLGRRLVDGARSVRIFGEEVPVRARIATLGGLSAHADQASLLNWLRGFRRPPSETYVVHGEAAAAQAFADHVRRQLGWRVSVPEPGETADV
jgi:metallo-beta-lactamase family protein